MERVESQEAKLKKIRAMRGQVDYSKLINGNLCKPCDAGCKRTLLLVGGAIGEQAHCNGWNGIDGTEFDTVPFIPFQPLQ
jgi:hypothetical protein